MALNWTTAYMLLRYIIIQRFIVICKQNLTILNCYDTVKKLMAIIVFSDYLKYYYAQNIWFGCY